MTRAVLVFAGALALVACKKPPIEEVEPPAPSAPAASARPPDHLAPDELLEGTDKAFGLALPRGTTVTSRFEKTVYATGIGRLDPTVSYFRARVRDGTFSKGKYTATFEHVKVPGQPGRELRIKLSEESGASGTRMELLDSTPPPVDEQASPEDRMRAIGLTKDGKPLDPNHLD